MHAARLLSTAVSRRAPAFRPFLLRTTAVARWTPGVLSQKRLLANEPPKASDAKTGAKPESGAAEGKSAEPKQPKSQSPITWKSVAVLLVAGTGVVLYYQYDRDRRRTTVKVEDTAGKLRLGGPFEGLIDQTGKPRSSKEFDGQFTLIYFGFSHCPDVCPTELIKMGKALDMLEKSHPNLPKVQPLFISIDPQRDTPAVLAKYAKGYHPRIIWLTGTYEQIKPVAKAYRVYFSKPDTKDTDYLVDHSIFFYLMDRKGEILDYYGKNFTAEEVSSRMAKVIDTDLKTPA